MITLSIIAMRIWFAGMFVFSLSGLSVLVFKPSLKSSKMAAKGVMLAVVWPLALFSKSGRAVLLRAFKKSQGV